MRLAGNSLKSMTFVRHTGFGDCELIVQLKAIHMGDKRPPGFSPRNAADILQL